MALVSCMQNTLVKLKLKNCGNLQNVSPLFEQCKFLKYLDLTACSRIEAPAWLVPIGKSLILPQSFSKLELDNSNFNSVITLNSNFFSFNDDKTIFNSEKKF